MRQTNPDPRDPKNLPDAVSGVENNEQVTNSEDQQLIDDTVTDVAPSSSSEKTVEGPTLSDKEIQDIANIN